MRRVYFPATTFQVRVVLVGSETISPIQTLILRAVVHGVDTLDELRQMFGLSLRTAMELFNEILRQNLLTIDFRQGRFRVPKRVAESYSSDVIGSDSINSGGVSPAIEKTIALTLNRASGSVIPARALKARGVDDLPFTSIRRLFEVDDIPELVIVNAINDLLRSEGTRVRDLDRGSISIKSDGGFIGSAQALEWDPDDPDGANVTVLFDSHHRLPSIEAASLESFLLEARATHPWFWRALGPELPLSATEGRSRAPALTTPSLRSLIRTNEVGQSTVGVRDVIALLRAAEKAIGSSAEIDVLLGSDEVEAGVQFLLQKRTQTIFVTPSVLQSAAEAIADATPKHHRPIGVIHGRGDNLGSHQKTLLDRMASQGAIVGSASGGESSADFAVAGGSELLVGCGNILGDWGNSAAFTAAVAVHGGPLPQRALASAHELCPTGSRSRLRWRAEQLGWTVDPPPTYPLPRPDDLPDGLMAIVAEIRELQALGPGISARARIRGLIAGVQAWLDASTSRPSGSIEVARQEVLMLLRSILEECDTARIESAMLVAGPEHRSCLLGSLDTASEFVVLVSRRLGGNGIGARLASSIQSALSRGVDVILAVGQSEPAGASVAIEDLRNRSAEMPGSVFVNERPIAIDCNALLADDERLLITSLEFLRPIRIPQSRDTEMGLYVESRRISAKFRQGLISFLAQHDDALAQRVERAASAQGPQP